VHGSALGAGVVDVGSVVVVLVGSELGGGGAALVVVGVVLVGVVLAGVVVVLVVLAAPELPAAATLGVVDCGSTVASVWVCVRPGGTLGLVLASVLAVVGSVGFAGGLATVLCAVTAFGLVGLALGSCFTTGG
jgi:hypothetical protein